MNNEKLHNEPYNHFFLSHISFWHNQIWFEFKSNHTYIEHDNIRNCDYECVNGYTLQFDLDVLEKIPEDYYCCMGLAKREKFRLDYLIDKFKRNCIKEEDLILCESISKHPIKK